MAKEFQGQVNILPAIGVPGQHMSTNPLVCTQKGYCAANTVKIGGFVWQVTVKENDGEVTVKENDAEVTVKENDAFVQSTGTGAPLGFAVREITNPLGYNESASNTVPKGFPVSVAVKGDFAVITGTDATVGQSVFAVLADGSIITGEASATVAGAVKTDYKVVNINGSGAKGDIIVISNWA